MLSSRTLKSILHFVLRLAYRYEVSGLEHAAIIKPGAKVLVVVNHISFLDGALLMAALSELPVFAVNTAMANRWWLKPFRRVANIYPLDPTNPLAIKDADRQDQRRPALRDLPRGPAQRHRCPDEDLCRPGLHRRPDRGHDPAGAARRAGADAGSRRLKEGQVTRHWFPKITITICPPRKLDGRPGPARQGPPPDRQPAALRHHVRHGVPDHRLGPDPVRGAAARARPARLALPGARGHQRRPSRLHEAGGRRPGARPQVRRRHRARRARRRAGAQRQRRRGRLLRAAGLRPRAGDAQLLGRPGQPRGRGRHRADQAGDLVRRVRRQGQARARRSPRSAATPSSSGSRSCAARSAPRDRLRGLWDGLFARPHPSPASACSATIRPWSCSPRARRAGPRASCSATAISWPTSPRSRPGSTSTSRTRCSTPCRCSTASASPAPCCCRCWAACRSTCTPRRCTTGSSPSWSTTATRRSSSAPTASSRATGRWATRTTSAACATPSPGPRRSRTRPSSSGSTSSASAS